jgi:hypothetical protein
MRRSARRGDLTNPGERLRECPPATPPAGRRVTGANVKTPEPENLEASVDLRFEFEIISPFHANEENDEHSS